MAWSNVEQVFLHEVIHEVSLQRDARLTERQVRRMSEGLYEFFKTNEIVFSHKDDKDYRSSKKTKVDKKGTKKARY